MSETRLLTEGAQVERVCSRLIVDFAHQMDLMNYSSVLELFADDATLDRAGQVMRGHEEIHDYLEKRPARSLTRHLCSNIRVLAHGPDRADGSCYVQFFQAPNEDDRPLPLKVVMAALVEYHVGFVRRQNDWRIQNLRIQPVFQT